MASLSVISMSPSVAIIFISWSCMYSVIDAFGVGAVVVAVFVGVSSKFISVNTGAAMSAMFESRSVSSKSSPKSKSVGNGNAPLSDVAVSGCAGVAGCVVGAIISAMADFVSIAGGMFDAVSTLRVSTDDICSRPALLRARKYAARNSIGNPSGRGRAAGASSAAVGVSVVSGAAAGARCKNAGNGIVNNGAPVRTIIAVVDAYIGNSVKIIMPKTKPAKPWSCAFASRVQCAYDSISKPNNMRNRAYATQK